MSRFSKKDSQTPTVDLVAPLKRIAPKIKNIRNEKAEGSFHSVTFGEIEELVDSSDSKEASLDSEHKSHRNVPIAFSTPIDTPTLNGAFQLLRKHNVSSPFLMSPLYHNKEHQRIYPEADGDLCHFISKSCGDGKWHPKDPFLTMIGLKHFIGQIICGIDELHRNGLAHRDIKKDNILVFNKIYKNTKTFQLQITDFDFLIELNSNGNAIQKIGFYGTKEYLAPEMFNAAKFDKSKYARCDFKAADCYALGVLFTELFLITKTSFFEKNEYAHILKIISILYKVERKKSAEFEFLKLSELAKENKSKEHQQLIDLILKLIDKNPKTRATIKSLGDHPFFGETAEARQEFFHNLHSHNDYHFVHGFCHTSCPEIDDNSAVLPTPLSKIYLNVTDLNNQFNYLSRWPLQKQFEKSTNAEKFLEHWINFEASKESFIKNANQVLNDINKLPDDLFDSQQSQDEDDADDSKPAQDQITELKDSIENILNHDVLKSGKNPIRKKVYDDITSFLEAKEKLYFKPKFIKGKSQYTKLSDIDYIEQWLSFHEQKQDKQDVEEKGELALQSIAQAIDSTDSTATDKTYQRELTALKSVILNQLKSYTESRAILEKLHFCLKEQLQPQDHKTEDNTQAIEKTCQLINHALTLPAICNDKPCYAELITVKKILGKLNPTFNTIFDEQYEDRQTADAINYMQAISSAYDSSLVIQNTVNEAYNEYIRRSSPDNKKIFCNRMELTFFHWGKNRIATEFKAEIDNLISTQLTPELPKQLLDKIDVFLINGKGNNRNFSFKTILHRKISRMKAGLKLDRKETEDLSIKQLNTL